MAAARKASSSAPSAVPRRRSGDSSFSVAIRSSRVGGDGGALGKKRENSFIIFLREKRWPLGRRGIATRVARHVSHGPHFSMFSKVLRGDLLVYCMDVQLSTYRCSGSAPAGEGQARRLASRLGA